jgi:hypothetical protein
MIIFKEIGLFTSGVNQTQFTEEIFGSGFAGKVQTFKQNAKGYEFTFSDDFSHDDELELTALISNHVPIVESEFYLRASVLLNHVDYHKERGELKDLATSMGFDNMTEKEKELCAKHCLVDANTLIVYYLGRGLTMEDAVTKYKVRRSIDISLAAKALSTRASSPVVTYIAVKYLNEADASAFSDAIRNFVSDLRESAHLGLAYGQARDGIMDYIEATGSYLGAGLKSYSFENGFTYEQCRDEFKNYLVYGNKPAEFDVFSIT